MPRCSAPRDTSSRPGDTLAAIGNAVGGAYAALFRGSIYNVNAPDFARGIRPFTETLTFATPLIAAGLGVALAFRIGMFNIGGRGQMLMASAGAGWIAFGFDLPFPCTCSRRPRRHAGGALWGGIVGLLKARTGAHEVIVTIMLNYVAFYLISWMLRTPGLLQAPGSSNPKSPAMKETRSSRTSSARVQPALRLHPGDPRDDRRVVAPQRSSLGFKFRAVGENPNAARVAGIDVKNMYVYAMLIAGALAASRASTRSSARSRPASRRHRRGHRLRRDHGRPPRPLAVGHVRRRHPVRRVQGGRVRHAGQPADPRSTSSRRAVAHRAVHRGAAARAHDLLPRRSATRAAGRRPAKALKRKVDADPSTDAQGIDSKGVSA
jgi:hypothetical protein